ncbi:chaperone NapD [Anaerosinus massiliensis]|uniref:chaperone NapD n=1 Tax=Massilibacillus massiliensis TaxID=1806837 RepID=UPI000DA60B37|nr:chaperone NapD [Massilibacillus massiliensis]
MAIASIIVQPIAQDIENITSQLAQFQEIEIHSVSPKGEIILLLEADNLNVMHTVCTKIEQLKGVAGVFPSYITTADEES